MEGNALVSAFFPERGVAERAFNQLPQHGIGLDQVSVIGPKGEITQASSGEIGDLSSDVRQHKVPITSGIATGAAVGGAVGLLGGFMLAAGFLILPAVGLFVAGPIAGALVGAGVTNIMSTLKDALRGTGMSDYEAAQVVDRVAGGGYVLAIAVDMSQVIHVRRVLQKLGGEMLAVEHVAGVR